MFKYSCSAANLVNWVYSQVNDQAGAVFPRRKGWSFFIRTFYPAGTESGMLAAVTANNAECVVFFPVDDTVDNPQIVGGLKPGALENLNRDFRRISCQSILIASERQEERMLALLEKKRLATPLLVLYADRIEFRRGNFNNPRLEFRVSQLKFDPDLIPGVFRDSRIRSLGSSHRTAVYQSLFHLLNHYWLVRQNRISLRRLVNRSIPCWNQFRRADQQSVYQRIQAELDTVFGKFFEGLVRLEVYRKREGSQPEEYIVISSFPDSRKTISDWNRKQRQALGFLNDSGSPLTIEALELFIN